MEASDVLLQEIDFGKGQLFLIGSRPAVGKTSFAKNIVNDLISQGKKVAIFSLGTAIEDPGNPSVTIINQSGLGVLDIEAHIHGKPDIVFIDYIQLIDRGDGSVSDVEKDLYDMALRLSCPVVILSQLTREIEDRESKIPMPSDLKATGLNIDLYKQVFLLYRESYYNESTDDSKLTIVLKDRMEEIDWVAGNYHIIA